VNAVGTRTIVPALLCLVVLTGCTKEPERMPAACLGSPQSLLSALQHAPGAVVLADGTRLSRCVSLARTDGDLQSLGLALMRVSDTLRAQAGGDLAAALQLGYLAGAVRAGAAAAASGIADQLARRIEQVASLDASTRAAGTAALQRGRRAGESSG
jgi:hypothetical protein